ncbi:uncharacterized protein TM35_000013750 [Trypanosoma theileri]|uniref:Amastin surface glycoprotein n=1 Tax=Trypanosoma theileri TaxID=67003 RepID=A0A1X0P9D7_9TRYP|nr:uncharacterized protein TM35_000013750 [Trypanosoma theileri]ORC93498.1 hypothetical protein TM35_000013750 [Trypanosoma theileri]
MCQKYCKLCCFLSSFSPFTVNKSKAIPFEPGCTKTMICARVFVLILAIVATACAACANVFAVFQKEVAGVKTIQTLWYSKVSAGPSDTVSKVADSVCAQFKLFFTVCEGVTVGAAGLGFIVVLLAIVRLFTGPALCFLKCLISFLLSLAFAASGVCVALVVYGYLKGYCQDDAILAPLYLPFKESGFDFWVSFYLICIACGLFMITNLFQCCA